MKFNRITRRRLLASAGGLLAAGVMPAWRSRADAPGGQVVRLGFSDALRSQNGAAARSFADSLRQASAGRYAIEIFGDGTLGSDAELLEAVRLGAVPLALVSQMTVANLVPEIGVFAIPFLFRGVEAARRAVDGPIGAECLDLARGAGVIPVGWSEDGVRHLTSTGAPVRRPADLRGMRLPVPRSDAEILGFRAMGANVTVLAEEDVFAALQRRRMDGQENTIAAMLAAELWRVQACLSLTGHVYAPAMLIAAEAFWGGLPPDDQNLFRQAAQDAAQAARAFNDEADEAGVALLRGHGMAVVADIDRDAFAAAVAPAEPPFARLFGDSRIAALRAVV